MFIYPLFLLHRFFLMWICSISTQHEPIFEQADMVFIEGGTFQMGDAFGLGQEDEKPVHTVNLSDFYISKYEVNVGEFSDFIRDTDYKTDADQLKGSKFWNGEDWIVHEGVNWQCDANGQNRDYSSYDHPVIHVSWNDAVNYCNWLSKKEGRDSVYKWTGDEWQINYHEDGYRLPTEAEWEFVAHNRESRSPYIWKGENIHANVADEVFHSEHEGPYWQGYSDAHMTTAPVDTFEQGIFGVCHIIGNVWEWCGDWYGRAYYAESENMKDPVGPATGTYRMIRGGSWSSEPIDCRIAQRTYAYMESRFNVVGFRVARGH